MGRMSLAGVDAGEGLLDKNKAARPVLSLPLKCTLGTDCWTVNYVDHDMTSGIKDLRCSKRSYDGHSGMDFALADRMAMLGGVDVLAPADGVVLETRNTEADHDGSRPHIIQARQSGKQCGNKVVLKIGDDWFAELCHLKQGSIEVNAGDVVTRGQKIAEVGLSGMSSFAHLHIGVKRQGNDYIETLTGQHYDSECTPLGKPLPGHSMWDEASGVTYDPVHVYAAGFLDDLPLYEVVRESVFSYSSMPVESTLLTFWAAFWGLEPGDQIDMFIKDPAGRPYAENHQEHDRHSAQYMYYVGKKTAKAPLVKGVYTGEAILTRKAADGTIIKKKITKQLTVR